MISETTTSTNISAKDFEAAFTAIEHAVSPKQKVILIAHYSLRTAAMEDLARAAGYSHYGAANLQYGRMCGLLAAQLDLPPNGARLSVIASVAPQRNDKGHHQWTMKEPVAKALEHLGWV